MVDYLRIKRFITISLFCHLFSSSLIINIPLSRLRLRRPLGINPYPVHKA
jgi:hypothetical protein